jgi:hypothetical protein
MRIAHVALWTHDLDGRRNSNSERFRCFDRRGYPAKALGFRQRCSDQAFPVALVPPLSRPFLPFGDGHYPPNGDVHGRERNVRFTSIRDVA